MPHSSAVRSERGLARPEIPDFSSALQSPRGRNARLFSLVNFPMLLGFLVANPSFRLAPYDDPYTIPALRIRMKRLTTSNGDKAEVRFTVDGHIYGKTVENVTLYPVRCDVPRGIAGTYAGAVSGAYTFPIETSFVSWPGYGRVFNDGNVQAVNRDGTILLARTDEPSGGIDPYEYKSEPGSAWIVRHDRRVEIGPAESVELDPDGAVSGYALRRPNGSYCGASFPYSDARPEAFVWKAGARRTLGEWILQCRNARGTAVGYRVPTGRPDLPEGEAPRDWVRWRGGHLEALDFHGLSVVRIWLRADDSLLLELSPKHAGIPARAALWSEGHVRTIPDAVGGHRLDWSTLAVDGHDVATVKDAKGHSWRLLP